MSFVGDLFLHSFSSGLLTSSRSDDKVILSYLVFTVDALKFSRGYQNGINVTGIYYWLHAMS